ncbi:hypothetical protein RRU94_10305 [Domibacillus sp. DTU_2020_1001157_1_SI_ALB_TIR_016]|uniref:Rok-like winged helix domain-containing protein n=1 Tax=Domibacillus sp. DTU_2020_1001157_1_SI_ALB_TIR_016 TaxID=3077789 RepID=UPI0028EBC24F|nr:hypothetical protein [Domibacillus sp. DTU_2020_1001157_1_SI_ALB_TIR_016]WNS81194.1 hypothetical protein RRU94_10305 [Domibacillus sp. DTU_2020_1001157_1_SI_ALB_TIR_016]
MSGRFTEQQAIKTRLSQIDQAEAQMLDALQEERDALLKRLQELENSEGREKEHAVSRRPRENVHELREVAVAYLKERKEPVRAVEIQEFVELATSKRISNMSSFMKALEPEYDRVVRLGRGLYIYEYGVK